MIDLVKLEHIVVLAKLQSYTRASEALLISQPALSRSVQSVERQLGVKIFDRSRAGVFVTATGGLIIQEAERLLMRADNFGSNVDRILHGQSGTLKFGIGSASVGAVLPEVLRQTSGDGVTVSVAVDTGPQMRKMLLAGELDFYVARLDQETEKDPRIAIRKVGMITPHLFVRRGHPLLQTGAISFDDLRRYPIASGTAWSESIRENLDVPRQGLPLSVEIDNYEILAELAATTDTILVAAYADRMPKLTRLPLDLKLFGGASSTVCIFEISGRTPSPLAVKAQACLAEFFANPALRP